MGALRTFSITITLLLAILIALPSNTNGTVNCSSDSLKNLLLQMPLPPELQALADEQAICLSDHQSTTMDSALVSLHFKDIQTARKYFTDIIEAYPGDDTLRSEVYLLRGQSFHYSGDLESASADYLSATTLKPGWARAWSQYAFILNELKRHREGLQLSLIHISEPTRPY